MPKDIKKGEERRAEINVGPSREGRMKSEGWESQRGERGESGRGERGLQPQGSEPRLQPWGWQTSPFSFMRRFTEDMDRLFEDFWGGGLTRGARGERGLMRPWAEGLWIPPVEVRERDGELLVRADLPGVNKDDLQVECSEDSITIRGERRAEREENKEGYYESERSYGSFLRTIPLPEGVNADKAKANFENGVLEIRMPAPKQLQRGRRIQIESGAAGGKKMTGREEAA